MNKLNPFKSRNADARSSTTAVPSARNSQSEVAPSVDPGTGNMNGTARHSEKGGHGLTSNRIPNVTMRTFLMAILVAMGGFIFGYDTGQISGFLEMDVFLERFGQKTAVTTKNPSGYYFTNVRSGLIVALVWFFWRPLISII
jgi:hypothetical protein